MTQMPYVSVAIPTYNSARYLAQAVDSILGQTVTALELILYDDGSTDETLHIGEAFQRRDPRVRVVRGEHVGIAANRNRAFAATNRHSSFVCFFDHDDVWERDALETLLDAVDTSSDCAGAHGVARCIDSDGNFIRDDDHADYMRRRFTLAEGRLVPVPITAPTTFDAELFSNYITTPRTSIVRRSVLERVGGFEPSTVPCDDWDLNLRLCRHGHFAFADRIILNWRRHPAAASNLSKRWRTAYLRTRRRSIDSPENTPAQREAARQVLLYELTIQRRAALEWWRQRNISRAVRKVGYCLVLTSMLHGLRWKSPSSSSIIWDG